jgi:hypothetical protein
LLLRLGEDLLFDDGASSKPWNLNTEGTEKGLEGTESACCDQILFTAEDAEDAEKTTASDRGQRGDAE